MFNPRITLVAGAACLAITCAPTMADELLIEGLRTAPSNTEQGVLRPERGLTKAAVRERFGEPDRQAGPVGDPPISYWVYDRFTVYFEHEHVIHSVFRREQ